ncbi:GntR family transcriptional regulator [Microbaculum marinisediminis]|uniref:GntR family transcriptional regulator n=1 Tax=Microbaculum marinisediminis TaxID=2931392 RepID=A0AAW5QVF2_9HYPH|nr:GntR family transcriptional regulator [Microbaculum sp. A6E488]MCT8970977.1 GntR family transcriptional regulator [Microbaculum sp. A6E488]
MAQASSGTRGRRKSDAAAKDAAAEDRSQRERAFGEIRRRILENELPAGVQMLETEVADMLGMSRTPVREALIRLAEEGLVEIRPRHGMRVRPVSPDDMREIYDVLTSLEATAASLAAARGLPPAELAALDRSVADMDKALKREDLKAWAKADERFHDLLVAGSGNKRLGDIVATMRDQAHRARMSTLMLRPLPTESNEDHRAVVEAIRDRDPEAAFAAHQHHRKRSGTMLVELLTRLGLGAL